MHQRKYDLELISELGLSGVKPAVTPIDTSVKHTSREYDEYVGGKDLTSVEVLTDQGPYQRLIGKLLYLTVTRPDIAYSIQLLSQYLQQPKRSHMKAAQRIVRYIKNQPGRGLLLSSKAQHTVTAFSDADWAACPKTRRSLSGFLVKIGESMVFWKS